MTDAIIQLKVTLRDTKPPVWRRVQLRDCTLSELHEILQTTMGWGNGHLWSITVGQEEFGDPEMTEGLEFSDAGATRLGELLAGGIRNMEYLYDFGDGWQHRIQIEKVLEAEPGAVYPRCVDGAMACPPEDCGGVWGYSSLIEAMADPKNTRREELLEWLGEEFHPEAFDIDATNRNLNVPRPAAEPAGSGSGSIPRKNAKKRSGKKAARRTGK